MPTVTPRLGIHRKDAPETRAPQRHSATAEVRRKILAGIRGITLPPRYGAIKEMSGLLSLHPENACSVLEDQITICQ
jgi:hypothetical protein